MRPPKRGSVANATIRGSLTWRTLISAVLATSLVGRVRQVLRAQKQAQQDRIDASAGGRIGREAQRQAHHLTSTTEATRLRCSGFWSEREGARRPELVRRHRRSGCSPWSWCMIPHRSSSTARSLGPRLLAGLASGARRFVVVHRLAQSLSSMILDDTTITSVMLDDAGEENRQEQAPRIP
jgi:hypothetical protein